MKIKLTILISAFILMLASFLTAAVTAPNAYKTTSSALYSSNVKSGYYLRTTGNKIGVYEAGSNTPMQILDTQVANLPNDARELLSKGIYCKDKTELLQRIEDFTS